MEDIDWADQITLDIDGLAFDVWTAGDGGEPVVLLHGFPETAASWGDVAPSLVGAGAYVIVPNQRGYSPGARPSEVGAYAMPHLVDDVLGILDALGLDSAHVVGHDWGASVAWSLAAAHPDRVRTLTAVSVPHLAAYGWALRHDEDQQKRSQYIGLFRQEGKAEDLLLEDDGARLRAMFGDAVGPDLVDVHVGHLSDRAALTAALNWYRAMTSDLGRIPAVRVPTTYVWSTEDMALGRAGAERCREFVEADYAFAEIEGVSHWIPEEAPATLASLVIERAGLDGAR